MARAPSPQLPFEQLRPVASPVDTFVKPAQSPLRGLAESLSVADRSLQTLLQTRDEAEEKKQETLGKAAFYNDRQGEFAKAVSDGKVPAQTSPFYVRGFKNAQGEAAGESLRTKWQDAWDSWGGKDSDDPGAFDKFFHGFVADSVGSKDPDVLKGILPTVEALQQNATTQYTQYRHDKTVTGNLTTHGAVITGGVQDGLDAGLLTPKGPDYEGIFNGVNQQVAKALANGDPGDSGANTFIDTMSAKILESHDANLLKWFDTKVPGKDYTWGETPHGLEVKNATTNNLETIAHQQQARLTAQQQAEAKQAKEEAESSIVQGIIKDPYAAFDEKWLTQAEKNGDPTIRVQASEWRDTLLKGTPSNPQDLQGFYSKVIAGEISPQLAVRDAMSHGVFRNVDDLKSAQQFVQSFQGQQSTIEKTQGSVGFKDVLDAIRTRTQAKDPTTYNPISGWSNEGFEASSDFRELVTRFAINNPNATPQDIDEQVSKIGKQITDRIKVPDGQDALLSAQEYQRDADLPFANPWDGSPQENTENGDISEWEKANKVGPEEKAEFQHQAERAGMSYEEFIRGRAMKKPTDPTAAKKISFDPNDKDLGEGDVAAGGGLTQEQASGYIDRAFAEADQAKLPDEERTNSLLDLIGQGESKGNYNAVYGNIGNTRDLSQYTVDDILGHQQYARQNGSPSTAIGKYGFIYKTLRGLKSEMGLSGSEKFTPQLQDQMGRMLLNRRGLQAYRAGKISKDTFALSLSQEFASVPNPNTGRSFYDGDGLNKSRMSRAQVYDALGFTPISYRPDDTDLQGGTYNTEVAKPVAGLKWDGRRQQEVDGLTIHHTGGRGSVQNIIETLNKRNLGVQYIMDRDGTIYQTAPDGARFSHMQRAKNGTNLSNDNSVGIEVIADDDNDVTPAQREAAQRWIEEMRSKHPTIGENVYGHGELNPGHKEATEGMSIVNEWRSSHSKKSTATSA